jgi:hypothetical protein
MIGHPCFRSGRPEVGPSMGFTHVVTRLFVMFIVFTI